jgi:adenosylcobinamide-GDP ribazoletransferase
MKTLVAAIGLLTRIPVPAAPDPEIAGRATRWFPLIGAVIGCFYSAVAWTAAPHLPAAVVAVLVVIAEALLTGALHIDGLADTADGFGGGKSRDDILRIMRDPAIGSYGAVAIALLVALKIAVLSALLDRHTALPYLVLAPVLSRWTAAPLSRFLNYARPAKSAPAFAGTRELVWATILTAAIVSALGVHRALMCSAAVAVVTGTFGALCYRKIGGITGDTLGAAIEISECAVLLAGLVVSR